MHDTRVEYMRSNQHWMTMKILFSEEDDSMVKTKSQMPNKEINEVGVQVAVVDERVTAPAPDVPTPAPRKELRRSSTFEIEAPANNKCLESQLKQAMSLASNRNALLLETENRLAEAQGRVKAMEKCIEEKDRLIKEHQQQKDGFELEKRDENVFSVRNIQLIKVNNN